MKRDRSAYYAATKDRYKARLEKWRTANPEKYKAQLLRAAPGRVVRTRKYRGMPTPTRPMPQHCELCGLTAEAGGGRKILCLDHCHISGIFRGWLCNQCNVGLGSFRDNPVLMERAADYIRFGGA